MPRRQTLFSYPARRTEAERIAAIQFHPCLHAELNSSRLGSLSVAASSSLPACKLQPFRAYAGRSCLRICHISSPAFAFAPCPGIQAEITRTGAGLFLLNRHIAGGGGCFHRENACGVPAEATRGAPKAVFVAGHQTVRATPPDTAFTDPCLRRSYKCKAYEAAFC